MPRGNTGSPGGVEPCITSPVPCMRAGSVLEKARGSQASIERGMTMAKKIVVKFEKPKHLMPAHWRQHVETLTKTEAEIEALQKRLRQEALDFSERMNEDLRGDNLSPEDCHVVESTLRHFDKCARDALVLLDCAAERVGFATPSDADFEFGA